MEKFALKKVCNSKYSYLILSTSYLNPLNYMNEIESCLNDKYEGGILFDLLLSTGNSSNRFLEGFFDGVQFDLNSFKIVKLEDEEIKRESLRFFQENIWMLDNSVLTNINKFLIKKGKLV
ncbi:MAG: type II toxin-antitoxin system RnlB family antitoxin [Halanaerobiales bacterium]|nr:type II toxin-antitoxin system RnlB family antitoxin [Halanaerobiales bacterium]